MAAKIGSIRFNNYSNNREHNIFTPEYYGGADIRVLIDDKPYDNITSIAYSVREQKKPIYSYASRIYDDIANGSRIVQGTITVPVKNETAAQKKVVTTNNNHSIIIPSWINSSNKKTEPQYTENNEKPFVELNNIYMYLSPDSNIKEIVSGSFKVREFNEEYFYVENYSKHGFIKKVDK